jgi:long-chain alkane monooxygenase
MAAVTRNLGFAATFSTSYESPFAFARRVSTLDHLTRGRVGWNIVTSYLPNAARNFGLDDEIEHEVRYCRADEFVDVVLKLREGSWDDDAVRADRSGRIYADPDKVRRFNHVGEFFRIEGPHLTQPSPRRTPVLFQAGDRRPAARRRAQRGSGVHPRPVAGGRSGRHRGHSGPRRAGGPGHEPGRTCEVNA